MQVANKDNLIPGSHKLTLEEQSAGGKASVDARRKRKELKEELLLLLSDGDIQKRITAALINEAIKGNKAGSVTRAFEVIRDTIGEKPIEKVMISEVDQAIIEEVEKAVLDDTL